jgi:hypothetical protein
MKRIPGVLFWILDLKSTYTAVLRRAGFWPVRAGRAI